MTPNEQVTAVAAASLGICPHCTSRFAHDNDCPAPHVGWADGTEVCDRCRHGLDAGEGYLAATTERIGTFEVAVGLVCLPCGLGAA